MRVASFFVVLAALNVSTGCAKPALSRQRVPRSPLGQTGGSIGRPNEIKVPTRGALDTNIEVSGGQTALPMAELILGDIVCAGIASFCLSPFVASVDKAIVEYASGSSTMAASILKSMTGLVTDPLNFFQQPAFLMIWGVYFITYIAANVVRTVCKKLEVNEEIPKFVIVTILNTGACVAKDAVFAKIFGSGPARKIPAMTYALFYTRDMLTMLASFNFVSTPIHLMGLNLYNSPGLELSKRFKAIGGQYRDSCTGRMGRILPAFGFGGIGNNMLRDGFHAKVMAV